MTPALYSSIYTMLSDVDLVRVFACWRCRRALVSARAESSFSVGLNAG